MKNVLIINQSSELYGADKALLELLENYPKNYNPIVVLEHEGPLKELLLAKGIKVIKCPVVKLNRSLLNFYGLFRVFFDIFRSLHIIRKETKKTHIDLVHSNAISVLLGAFYCFFYKTKHLWHVHEIVEEPKIIAKLYPKIVYLFSDKIVFNSKASYNQFLKFKKKIVNKSAVVYNGQKRLIEFTDEKGVKVLKQKFLPNLNEDSIVIGMVGRISRWKGQKLLLSVFEKLLNCHYNISLVYIGSAPDGQEHFLESLIETITKKKLSNKVTILKFQQNIWQIYDFIDIVVVPSIEPEPFGLVATEAMLSKKPVVAANHGGLSEIVVHEQTGLFFEPKNSIDLEKQLEILINSSELRKRFGENGYKRVKDFFSTEKYVTGIEKSYNELTD